MRIFRRAAEKADRQKGKRGAEQNFTPESMFPEKGNEEEKRIESIS